MPRQGVVSAGWPHGVPPEAKVVQITSSQTCATGGTWHRGEMYGKEAKRRKNCVAQSLGDWTIYSAQVNGRKKPPERVIGPPFAVPDASKPPCTFSLPKCSRHGFCSIRNNQSPFGTSDPYGTSNLYAHLVGTAHARPSKRPGWPYRGVEGAYAFQGPH